MRKDLDKVVKKGKGWPGPEKGRRPAGRARRRAPDAVDPETARGREPMARFTDDGDPAYASSEARHTALVRLLRGRVGAPWDAIYSELCAAVRSDPLVRRHPDWYVGRKLVALHVRLKGGVPWAVTAAGDESALKPGSLYVCPASGLLERWGGKAVRP